MQTFTLRAKTQSALIQHHKTDPDLSPGLLVQGCSTNWLELMAKTYSFVCPINYTAKMEKGGEEFSTFGAWVPNNRQKISENKFMIRW